MKKQVFYFLTMLLSVHFLYAQEQKPVIRHFEGKSVGKQAQVFTVECQGLRNVPSTNLQWRQILSHKCISYEPEAPHHEAIEAMKAAKLKLKMNSPGLGHSSNGSKANKPIIGKNFAGNENSGSSPMDNSIAISNGGWIVSVANTTIQYVNMQGQTSYIQDLATFIGDNGIQNVCDPVVLYDPSADRFILYIQECSGGSANSYVMMFFSKSNDPNDGWWYYKLTGNPLNDGSWFDYPKMGISTKEVYVTGNLFSDEGQYNQSVIYQIDKINAYNGSNIKFTYWYGIDGSPFTLCPLSYGLNATYGPGCYFAASDPMSSSTIKFYNLTNYIGQNPEIKYYPIEVTPYSPASDSHQTGTQTLVDNGDTRTMSGFFLGGVAHFAFHSDAGSGWNGINYNRIDLNAGTLSNYRFDLSDLKLDVSYPAVVSAATNKNNKSVIIGFGSSGQFSYPQMRAVYCDNDGNWSESVVLKESESYVGYTSNTEERWGDYTGAARKQNANGVSIWLNGMYANSNHRWDTWISEVHLSTVGIEEYENNVDNINVYPNPLVETFKVEFDLESSADLDIQIVDINGKQVKNLYHGHCLEGTNVFSFNKANLSQGVYFLTINTPNKIIANEKIVVSN